MKCFRKILASGLVLFIIHYSLFIIPAFAQGEIESSQQVTYQVFENGVTHVTHNVRLTNTTTNYYASEYSLFLGFTDLEHISAQDLGGAIKTDVAKKENGTDIHLSFNDQIVGKGKSLVFTISYDTQEVASRNGRIWEVDIPRIKDSKEIGDYTTTLSVPVSFGNPSYIKPASVKGLVFQKEDVLQGISVIFGDYQIFDFTLLYHLKNDRLYPILTEIAIPPSTAYQEVLLENLIPTPTTVYTDKDGNWLAKYRLEPSEKLTIKALGKVKIFNNPINEGRDQASDLSDYLKPQKYWETLDPKILAKAKELKTPRAIYDYVVQTLTYDYSRIEKNLSREGAVAVFGQPDSAICMEFTDLFIALARAAGIPAREVDGFASTKNERLRPLGLVKDILHAWPQYYDKEKGNWISIDPTWANTGGINYFDSFDFNHFAFVVKGLDSEYPTPAGSYKEEADLDKQDVDVDFAKGNAFVEKRSITMAMNIENMLISGLPAQRNLVVSNLGNRLFNEKILAFSSEKHVLTNENIAIPPIPPFGVLSIPITLRSPSYLDAYQTSIKARIGNEQASFTLRVSPLYLVYLPWIGGGVGVGIIFIVARNAWSVYIQKRKPKDSLRRQGKQSARTGFKLPWKKS